MQKQHYSIVINAPREKVWEMMLGDAGYREWTKAFNPGGSWYEGGWNTGDDIRFLGPGENGELGGMISRIAESRKPEFVSIEHRGMLQNGVEDFDSDMVKSWQGAHENYTLNEVEDGTEVLVDIDIDEAMIPDFDRMWPEALAKLKEVAER